MQFLRHKLGELIIFLIILTPTILVYTLLLYLGKATSAPTSFRLTTFIMGCIIMFLMGFVSGNLEQKKGWVAGMTTAFIIVLFFLIFKLFQNTPFTFQILLKYLSYLAIGAFGGMIGVNVRPMFRR